MQPSSPMAPFTPAILAELPNPVPEPSTDEVLGIDKNPLAPLAPIAVGPQGECCGGGGGEGLWARGPNGSIISTGGAVGINDPNPHAELSVITTGGGPGASQGITCYRYTDDSYPPIIYEWKSRGTLGSPQPVQPGDWIMYFGWGGYIGQAAGGFDQGAIGARMIDNTLADFIVMTNDGTDLQNGYERLRVTAYGQVQVTGQFNIQIPGAPLHLFIAPQQSQFQIGGLPTSSAGLPSGCLWNNGGAVHIVP